VFARLFYVALNLDYFTENWLEIVMLQHGGLVWFGGFLGATVSCLLFIRIKKLPLGVTLDLLVPYVALGQSLGRIGCFFNGCCYGKPFGHGIYFPVHGATLFPSQLVDSLTLLMIFVILRIWAKVSKRDGEVFALSFVFFGLQRFLMEFIRGDERPFYFSLSIFQWISLFVSVVGIIALIYLWKKKSA
jgi:phosphatidylglycerol:prolipoprotein diacylglycerol transferase